MELKNLYKNLKEEYCKDYFTIDIDGLNWLNIVKEYARLFAYTLSNNVSDWKKELNENNLFRITYSSSKSGVHIKVNINNTLYENFYYRAFFNDDIYRLKQDIIRMNHSLFTYDIAFKQKSFKNVVNKKDFKLINPLKKLKMGKKTFYLLIKYYQANNMKKVAIVLNNYKKHNKLENQDNLVIDSLGIHTTFNDFSNDDISELQKILLKYSNKDKTINLKNDYSTKKPLELSKAIYRYIMLKQNLK